MNPEVVVPGGLAHTGSFKGKVASFDVAVHQAVLLAVNALVGVPAVAHDGGLCDLDRR